AAGTILERIGEGLAVVDAQGSMLWSDARFKMADDAVRAEFVRLLREALEQYNKPAESSVVGAASTVSGAASPALPGLAANSLHSKRFSIVHENQFFELVISPASFEAAH